MDANTAERGRLDTWLSRVPALTGLVSLTTLVLAVSREAGYFSVVGRHYQPLLTTTDYIVGCVFWLPFTLFLFACTILLDRLAEPLWSRLSHFLLFDYFVTVAIFVIMTFLSIRIGSIAALILALAMIGLITFIFIKMRGLRAPTGSTKAIFAAGVCMVPFWMAFVVGEAGAVNELRSFGSVYRLVLKQDRQVRWIVLLRSVEGGALIHDPRDRRIEFIRWADIDSFGNTADATPLLHRALCTIGLQNWCGGGASDTWQRE
jgi:hypothetical protein